MVGKGVKQTRPLWPYLFIMFVEESIKLIKRKTKGVKIIRTRILRFRFKGDIVLINNFSKELNEIFKISASRVKR